MRAIMADFACEPTAQPAIDEGDGWRDAVDSGAVQMEHKENI
jgi:hypothetical protein